VLVVSHDRDFLDRVCTGVIMSEGEGRWEEYAGGYSDMLSQRGEGVRAREAAKPAREAAAAPRSAAAANARQKLSFKDRHALGTLPATMERLQKEIRVLRDWLADPTLYGRDPKGFEARSKGLAEREAALAAAEEEWLRLELLREEVEG
jgi:ATP-binding cassette subfamily F protein uup